MVQAESGLPSLRKPCTAGSIRSTSRIGWNKGRTSGSHGRTVRLHKLPVDQGQYRKHQGASGNCRGNGHHSIPSG